MNIILTGSTSPIGKVLLPHLNKNHTVTEISRASGWDLTTLENQDLLIELTKDSDVFINLAHVDFLQGILLAKSHAKISISFTSLITQFPWSSMESFSGANYIAQKLFLEYVHKELKNSALISVSSYGQGLLPSVTDTQLYDAIDDVIEGRSILPTRIEVSNGLGDLSLKLS
jgi:nucleoside-diphosphate-sugar epimerase